MKRILHRFKKSLNFSGRDWAVLLLALLLAFSIWLIHNLSLRYSDYLKVSVTALCNLDGHSDISSNRCEVMARCRTTGYNVLKYNMRLRNRDVKVQFSPSVMKHRSGDTYFLTSSDLQEYSHLIYGDKVTVEYFVSDTLFFRFPEQDSKRVPVRLVHSLSFRPQYIPEESISCVPDSVTIYGEKFQIGQIDQVYTVPVKRSDIFEDVQGLVAIEKIRGVRMSVPEVRYSVDVARYVELRKSVQIRTLNVPADRNLLVYPSYVDVLFRCRYPMTGDPTEKVVLYVDYVDFAKSLSGKCAVRPLSLPESIISCDIEPASVDCVLEDRL